MASVNFNSAATSALRNLQSTNNLLDKTQSSISTGLKIESAKDNAAYWSISTSLKSDNKALETVSDALGLGAATIDTAYEGLNAAKDVLDEIKKKIALATQDGTDKVAIQSEIKQLQSQLTAIAESSTFSGQNFLAIDSGATGYDANKYVVSGFNRDSSGNVTLETIKIDTSSFALTNAKTDAEGILDAGKSGNALKGGLVSMGSEASGSAGTKSSRTEAADFAITSGVAGDFLNISYKIDGGATQTFSLSLAASAAVAAAGNPTIDELVAALNADSTFGAAATASKVGNKLKIERDVAGTTGKTIEIVAAAVRDASGAPTAGNAGTGTLAGVTAGTTSGGADGTAASTSGFATFATGGEITMDDNDEITFKISVDGGTATGVTINKATVVAAGFADGKISDAGEYVTVLQKALQQAGVTGVTVSNDTGTVKIVSSNAVTANGKIQVTEVDANKGTSVLTLDVTSADRAKLTKFLDVVNAALNKVTAAAADLGAIAKRVDLQKEFATSLMDTIDKGVSGLVDADMNEESTKLQALQVKQQLGVQALSIANQSAQNVLSLFRG